MVPKDFKKKVLKNGITFIHEYRDLPIVSFSVTNRFGGAFETSKIKGIAHFIEHLVFTGTKTRTHEDISREIEKKGGILNAYTSNEVTSFWFKLPSEHLFSGMGIITDMLNNPIFEEKKFEKEKKVIIEEIKMYHDSPQRFVHDKIEENLYDKPFGEGVIGSEKTINALSRDFVYDFFKKMYNASNFIITLVGKADFNKVMEYLENNFKADKNMPKIIEIKKINNDSVEERPGIDQAHYLLAFHAPLQTNKNYPALEILDAYLANGMSSRLFLEIREKRGLAYAVKGSISTEKNYSYYSIYAGTTKKAIPEVKKLILQEFENVKNITQKSIDETKAQLIGLKRLSKEDSSSVMNDLMFSELTTKAEDYYKHEEELKSVTLKQVKELAKISKYSTAAIVPK